MHRALELVPELASHLVTAQRLEALRGHRSSGLPALDGLLGGGWPRAALSEVTGRRGAGRSSVVLAALARAARAGEAAALVDAGGALDPRAALAAGVPLPRLLWIRCAPPSPSTSDALKAVDLVVSAGGFDVVALDLGDERPRIPTAAWVRLKHGAERQGTSVLVSTPARAVGAFAAAAVELSAATPRFLTDGPPLFDGARAKITCLRRSNRNIIEKSERSAGEAERSEGWGGAGRGAEMPRGARGDRGFASDSEPDPRQEGGERSAASPRGARGDRGFASDSEPDPRQEGGEPCDWLAFGCRS